MKGPVFRDQRTGQRFLPLAVERQTLTVFDLLARQKRQVNRLAWQLDMEHGHLIPESASKGLAQWRLMTAKEAEMAAKSKKMVKKAKAAKPEQGKVVNKPVRPGSKKALVFEALRKGGSVDAVVARLKGKIPKPTEAIVRKFSQWAVKRGMVIASKSDNGSVTFKPGKAELMFTGKQEK